MDLTKYLYEKYSAQEHSSIMSLIYGNLECGTRLALAGHIMLVFTIIGSFFDSMNPVIITTQFILAVMLMYELHLFTKTLDDYTEAREKFNEL